MRRIFPSTGLFSGRWRCGGSYSARHDEAAPAMRGASFRRGGSVLERNSA
ncbi:hypothetical protein LINGRAHAP2_LOCUS30695 [Linum grandiflorum]